MDNDYQKLRNRNAFIQNFTNQPNFCLGEFDAAREELLSLISEYDSCKSENYLNVAYQ